MPIPSPARRGLLVAAAVILAACATPTTLNTQWVNPAFAGKPPLNNLLVMAITRDSTNRRVFEDMMVSTLQARGVKAVPSYLFLPEAGPGEMSQVQDAVKASGANGVLTSRVVNVSQSVRVSPGMYTGPVMVPWGWGGFYGFYNGMWASSFYTPPQIFTEENVVADTRLFDTRDLQVVWSGSTTTTPGGASATAVIQQFVTLIVDTMAKDGVIPAVAAK